MWAISKALRSLPDSRLSEAKLIPYTISFCIRKRLQIDNLSELGKEKMPPESIIWDGTSKDIDDWLDKVIYTKGKKRTDETVFININEIE